MMKPTKSVAIALLGVAMAMGGPAAASVQVTDADGEQLVLKAGDPSLKKWILPDEAPAPADNKPSAARIALGKALFFDPRLSGSGQVTCVSCHLPERGWSDGMPTAVRFKGAVMTRATPTIVNLGYNSILMWDGRMPTLEKQGVGGQGPKADINAGSTEAEVARVVDRIKAVKGYQDMFAAAYPNEPITKESIGKAVAAFERSVVSNTSPFDRWLKGDGAALSTEQVRGFAVFVDPGKGNCAVCHAAPNFTDNGFHNVGLASFGSDKPDVGRFAHKPVARMKGAFKTPTLRDVSMTAPYFHDGSASTLPAVVEHYAKGGENQTNLSPNMKPLALTQQDKEDLVAFMKALTSPYPVFDYPVLPK